MVFAADGDPLAELVGSTEWTQPALFALEVALFRLMTSWGVRPDYLLGHSLGEITAAHLAEVLSLDDACVLVEARARLMQALPGTGAMVAVGAAPAEVDDWLSAGGAALSVAAVNGASSVVLSGDRDVVDAAQDYWAGRGVRVSSLNVSHAFHSALMEPMLADFAQVVKGLKFRPPVIPLLSNLTGEIATAAQVQDPLYWVRHVRHTVLFSACLDTLRQAGVTTFLEIGADATLTGITAEHTNGELCLAAALRPGHPEPEAALEALAQLFVAGTDVDWKALFAAGTRRVPLPAYAFQRDHYWLHSAATTASRVDGDHPLLGTAVGLADDGGVLLTGRLSARTHQWLADHRVDDTIVVPGTVFVELALRAGTHVDHGVLEELVLRSPLVLTETGSADLQVRVRTPEPDGRCAVTVHSRLDGQEWVCHATGTLVATEIPRPVGEPADGAWPPAGSEPVDVSDVYGVLRRAGLLYGSSFRGVRAVWRRGGELFAEVDVPEPIAGQTAAFGVHPALLDAALHPLAFLGSRGSGTGEDQVWLPFSWSGVRLYATGAGAGGLRVRLAQVGPDATEVTVADSGGQLVLTAGSLVVRPTSAGAITAGTAQRPLRVRWRPAPSTSDSNAEPGLWADLATAPADAEVVVVRAWKPAPLDGNCGPAGALTVPALGSLHTFLNDAKFAGARLVVLTRSAVVAAAGELPDVAQAAVWGLVRSAQTENPGRILLLDTDEPDHVSAQVAAAVTAGFATGEDQLAVRGGTVFVPRLERISTASAAVTSGAPAFGAGAVLVTGGTGTLGALVARHVVAVHGVRDVVLVGRRGAGAVEAVAELEELGARVRVAACDVSDRDALAELLADVERTGPVTGVVHAAGALADAPVAALTTADLHSALAAKAGGAWHLHELLGDRVSAFVLFSSVAGVFGGVGQGNYAAANVFLDALARRRRSLGMAGVSMSWGLWEHRSTMTRDMSERDLRRIRDAGLDPMPTAQALALFDQALAAGEPHLITTRLDTGRLRDEVPALLRDLVSAAPAGAPAPVAAEQGFAERLRAADMADREQVVTELVHTTAATVLGYSAGQVLGTDSTFRELGMDSLTGIELRNRLRAATRVDLETTTIFNYPTVTELAHHLTQLLAQLPEETQKPVERKTAAATDTLFALYRQGVYDGKYDETQTLTAVAAGLRATFTDKSGAGRPAIVQVSRGTGPKLICFMPVVAPMIDAVYSTIVAELPVKRDAWAVWPFGFAPDEDVPADRDVLAEAYADLVHDQAGGDPFVLVGYSSGGWIAHSVAERLESQGRPAGGVVLLDTLLENDSSFGQQRGELLTEHLLQYDRMPGHVGVGPVGHQLTAMAAFMRVFSGWTPGKLATPTLLVRSSELISGGRAPLNKVVAAGCHELRRVPGNHFSMMSSHADRTAAEVHKWLGKTR